MDRVTFKGFAYGAIAAASYGLNPLFALPLYADWCKDNRSHCGDVKCFL